MVFFSRERERERERERRENNLCVDDDTKTPLNHHHGALFKKKILLLFEKFKKRDFDIERLSLSLSLFCWSRKWSLRERERERRREKTTTQQQRKEATTTPPPPPIVCKKRPLRDTPRRRNQKPQGKRDLLKSSS